MAEPSVARSVESVAMRGTGRGLILSACRQETVALPLTRTTATPDLPGGVERA